MPSMLILSFVEWAGAFQRPQQMALGFARRGWDVTYVSPGYVHRRSGAVGPGLDLPSNLTILQPTALPGARVLGPIAAVNEASLKRSLRRSADRAWDAVIFNDPRLSEVVEGIDGEVKIWDCMDDLSAYAPNETAARESERRAIETADRVITGTASLADRFEGRHPHVRFIPCGVDAPRFAEPDAHSIETASKEIRAAFDDSRTGPLAGYFGAINERFDMALAGAMAEEGWRVLLIGPGSSRAPKPPKGLPVAWIGPRPYADLPGFLACMDLALIPYDTRGPHRFLYPVKALEYLAGGKPVLSTPLPDVVRFLSDFVMIEETEEDWRGVARRWPDLRAEAEAKAHRGRDYAFTRSWDRTIEEIAEELALAGVRAAGGA